MSLVILSGFVSGEDTKHHEIEDGARFVGNQMDADEAHAIRESNREGCPLCRTSSPHSHFSSQARRDDDEIGEETIPDPHSDFRDRLDLELETT